MDVNKRSSGRSFFSGKLEPRPEGELTEHSLGGVFQAEGT